MSADILNTYREFVRALGAAPDPKAPPQQFADAVAGQMLDPGRRATVAALLTVATVIQQQGQNNV